MKYNPKDAVTVIPEGEYEASIAQVITTDEHGGILRTQKGKGDVMEKVVFEVYVGQTRRKHTEYFINNPKALWRYGKLASALCVGETFRAGNFEASDYIGSNLRLVIVIEDDETYGERNRVREFKPSQLAPSIPPPPAQAQRSTPKPSATSPVPDGAGTLNADDIPF